MFQTEFGTKEMDIKKPIVLGADSKSHPNTKPQVMETDFDSNDVNFDINS